MPSYVKAVPVISQGTDTVLSEAAFLRRSRPGGMPWAKDLVDNRQRT
jgi:hypothetical protein